jgi:hypothetical protein
VGHSLGLVHTFNAATSQLMQYGDAKFVFADEPLREPLEGKPPVASSPLSDETQNAMWVLLKHSFGWSSRELDAFGAQRGTLDKESWSDLASRLFSRIGLSLSNDASIGKLYNFGVAIPGGGDGEDGWQLAKFLPVAGPSDLAKLSVLGMKGTPFRIVASSEGTDNWDVEFVADGDPSGFSGYFGGSGLAGHVVRTDPGTGFVQVLGSYAVSVSAVPEPSTLASMLAGLAVLVAVSRRRVAYAATRTALVGAVDSKDTVTS